MAQYQAFAEVYDRLMSEVDYDQWADFIEACFFTQGTKPQRILECACGTGSLSVRLAERGYQMTGLDISLEMLSIAERKARIRHVKIPWIHQDMSELNFNSPFDAVICACDGVNYLLTDMEVERFFQRVYANLAIGGSFIFDISSAYKLKEILGNHTFFYEEGDICYAWENEFDEAEEIIEMDLHFFVQEGAVYRRFDETHVQRAHQVEKLIGLLEQTGFQEIHKYVDFICREEDADGERIFLTAIKKGEGINA